jgi:LacI family gluconate utilization system Gnt-I transcriptional repressor
MREIAGKLPRRTALFASSDLVAFGAVTEARVLGIDVPSRLSVCGFGDFELSLGCSPAITTVNVDGAAMGELAAASLLSRIDGRPGDAGGRGSRIMVPFRIIARESS